jgi:hypothetical protein
MVKIYCGTADPIPEGYTDKGTRYQCLRKGIGVGLHLPAERIAALVERPSSPSLEKNATKPSVAKPSITKPKTYCGTSEVLPPEYASFATPYACLRKGVGVGMWKRKREM